MTLFGLKLPPPLVAAGVACREHLRLALLLSALVNILYLAPTIYMMQVYDRVVPTGGVVTLIWLTVVAAFAIGTLSMLSALRDRTMIRAGLRLDRLLAADILDRLLQRGKGNADSAVTMQAMREFDSLRQALSGLPAIALFDLPWTPVYIFVAFLIHPLLGLVLLFSAALLLGITILNERSTRAGMKLAMRTMSASYGAQERLAGQAEVVRALGMRRALLKRQVDERHKGLSLTSQHQFAGGRYSSVAKFLRLFLQSFALGVGAWLAIERQISTGAIIAASVLLSRALQPIEQLVAAWNPLLQARQAIETLTLLFEQTEAARTDRFELPPPEGRITLENVGVARPGGGMPLLAMVSLKVAPGDVLGVIGPSGAGKTTLARVIAGAIRADQGIIRIDGADMRDWDPERLARHIGYLPQDSTLLPGTIAENISRFSAASDDGDVAPAVIDAARIAGAHEMILSLPGGYDLQIGWNNEGLSAGQRQRIALARALYGMPSLLVLDEPNSALDAEGEAALARAITAMRDRKTTVIIVAHRASILSSASKLLLLANGRIDCNGPSGEVIAELKSRQGNSNLVEMKAG